MLSVPRSSPSRTLTLATIVTAPGSLPAGFGLALAHRLWFRSAHREPGRDEGALAPRLAVELESAERLAVLRYQRVVRPPVPPPRFGWGRMALADLPQAA